MKFLISVFLLIGFIVLELKGVMCEELVNGCALDILVGLMNRTVNKLWRNLKYDIRSGFGGNLAYYIGWIFLSILMVCFVTAELKGLTKDNALGCFGIASRFFLGVEKNDIFERTEMFEMPFEWFLLHTYVLFGIARYPRQDFDECGYNVRLRTRSRIVWWVSKVIWCCMHIVVTYALWLLTIAVISICLEGDLTFKVTNMYHLKLPSDGQYYIYAAAFIMPVFVDLAIGMIVTTTSFVFNSVIGLLAGIVVLLTSIFFHNRLLLGRYMMLFSYFSDRTDLTFTINDGLLLCVFVFICAFMTGYVVYARER